MPFKKGKSGNYNGRPTGSQNLITKETKEILAQVIKRNFTATKINRDLKELSPKQRLDFILRIVDFLVPHPKNIEFREDTNHNNLQKLLDYYNQQKDEQKIQKSCKTE